MGAVPGQSPLSRQRTQVCVVVSQNVLGALSVQFALPVHCTHCPLVVWPVAVLHTSSAVQRVLTRALHSSQVPSLWQAGVAAARAAQAVSPAALFAQSTQV